MAQAIPDVTEEKAPVKREVREVRAAGQAGADRPRSAKRDDNIVYVGKKPTMSYVLAVMTQLQSGASEIHVKARGRSISRAVDVAEVVKNRFMQNISRNISIGTETIEDRDKNRLNVSTIDIRMAR